MRHDIVTVGAATRDVFLRSAAIRVVRDDAFSTGEGECFALGTKIDIDDIAFEIGGGGINTAVGFVRQGFRAAWVGKIGAADARGQEILQSLRAERVDTSLVIRDRRRATGYSVILLTPRGERTVLVYRGASADFSPPDFPWRRMTAAWWYVSSLAGDLRVVRSIWREAKRRGARLAWNPGAGELRHGFELLRPYITACDIFQVNQEEAGGLFRLSREQDRQAFEMLRRTVRQVAVITRGTDGALAGTAKAAWHCTTHHVAVVDTTGAGDAFGSGFVGQFIRSRGRVPAALQFATANAESVIGRIGAQPGLLRRTAKIRRVAVRPLV